MTKQEYIKKLEQYKTDAYGVQFAYMEDMLSLAKQLDEPKEANVLAVKAATMPGGDNGNKKPPRPIAQSTSPNREILFRGKSVSTGKWIYGYAFKSSDGRWKIKEADTCQRHIVHPETIGQFIGITDSHSVRVFDDDTLHFTTNDSEQPEWQYGRVKWEDDSASFVILGEYDCGGIDLLDDFMVVGNVHDNPEKAAGQGGAGNE